MMGILDIFNATTMDSYFVKVFGDQFGSSPNISFWIVISLIVGFTALTIRYTFNPKDRSEYNLWKKEHWPTKIFICLMVGAISLFVTSLFLEFMAAISFLLTGSSVAFLESMGNGLFGPIAFAIAYSSGMIWVLYKKGKTYYRDIKAFAIFNLLVVFVLPIVTVSLILLRISTSFSTFVVLGLSIISVWILYNLWNNDLI